MCTWQRRISDRKSDLLFGEAMSAQNFPQRLPEKLKTIRETLGHSVEVMARHLDVTAEDVKAYEAGTKLPLPILLHYAHMGYVTVESLIDDQLDVRVGSLAKN